MLTRRQFLSGAAAPLAAQTRRRNLVFILVDDLRWDALGATGHPFSKTPHIDRLATEGALFTNAFVTTPLCSPSRSSFLTGRYVHATGVTTNGDNAALSHRLITFPRLLQESGYETAYVGKWHMGTDDSPRPGFDRWVSFRGQGQFEDPEINVDGRSSQVKGYMTEILSSHAVDFVRRRRSKPFCLYLAHKAVHGPFTPAARYARDYAGQTIRRAPSATDDYRGKPALARPVDAAGGDKNKKKKKGSALPSGDELILNQLRCLRSIDDGVGEILAALSETGQLDNTLIVFTSDNGYFWGEHRLGDKRWAYEESIRIPMLARLPGVIRPGMRISQLVLNIDIAPSMLEVAGVKPPATMHGRSFLPLLRGRTASWRDDFLAEYFQEKGNPRTPTWQAVRTSKWKYIHYPELPGMDELYDLAADPNEMNNLISDPKSAGALAVLRRRLGELLKQTA